VTLTALAAPFALAREQEQLAGEPRLSVAVEQGSPAPCAATPALENR
jgi:hypothetical protein